MLARDGRWVLGVIGGSAALLVVVALLFAWAQWQRYDAVLATDEPRIARVTGIMQAREAIEEALQLARQKVSGYGYPADTEVAKVASDLQAKMRDAFQSAGLNIVGSQQFPPRIVGEYQEVAMSVSAMGDTGQVQKALEALTRLVPHVRVEQLRLQPVIIATNITQQPPQQISLQARLSVIHLQGM